jgi:hypothetical protein
MLRVRDAAGNVGTGDGVFTVRALAKRAGKTVTRADSG